MSMFSLSSMGNCQVQENRLIVKTVKIGSVMLQSKTKTEQKQILISLVFKNKHFVLCLYLLLSQRSLAGYPLLLVFLFCFL